MICLIMDYSIWLWFFKRFLSIKDILLLTLSWNPSIIACESVNILIMLSGEQTTIAAKRNIISALKDEEDESVKA